MSSTLEAPQKYVLGLDLGSASLGWALIALDESDNPVSLIRAGVRIFEPGVDGAKPGTPASAQEIQFGKDQSTAVARRQERLRRRQLRRRVARQRKLFGVLQGAGLLPTGDVLGAGIGSEQRHRVLNNLDADLMNRYRSSADKANFGQMPLYALRKKALYEPLALDELGRVFFHLSQRRGFQSNRKDVQKKTKGSEDQGQVKSAIHELEQAIQVAGAQTLGEYLAGLDPHEQKVRRQWTGRKMFEKEFQMIWDKQKEYHTDLLTSELHGRIWDLLFFQRPVAAQKHLVGKCELEPDKRRAPWAALLAQQFRLLQKVNDLRLIEEDGNELPLNEDGRIAVFNLLENHGTQTFAKIKQHLGLPKTAEFNLERGKAKELKGNITAQSMRKVFGERWTQFSAGKQNQIVENWRNSEKDEELRREAMEHWGLDEAGANALVNEKAPGDYCSLSLMALGKILPLMRAGKSFKEAETEIYGNRFSGAAVHSLIPVLRPNRKHFRNSTPPPQDPLMASIANGLRNPAVERSITEMRKVVNAIVREYGKPCEIRIELARELKKPRSKRLDETARNRKREAENKALAERMHNECGMPQNPSRNDLEKAKLWVEQQGQCPYTGRSLPFSRLFDDNNGFDVDHILPRSRHPDDSYQNKVLCWGDTNRMVKRNQTPYEAFAEQDPENWHQILARVARWKNPGKSRKFEIRSTDELAEFSSRQLNDTRYTSLLAARLLSTLYGGRDLAENGRKRQIIFASSGAVTATLRRNWGFEQILRNIIPPEPNESSGKPRTDHRHHAIDAIVIALTRNDVIQAMARASALEPWQPGTRSWRHVPQPWHTPNFFRSVEEQVREMLTSHRPEHKVSGELHKGSNYGRPYLYNGKPTVHSRVSISALRSQDIEDDDVIVDRRVRDILRTKLAEIGGNPKAFEKPENTPYILTPAGKRISIRKVRIRETKNPLRVGEGSSERYVASGGIHHVELFVTRDEKRRETWDSRVVQITEAYERRREKKPVVARTLEEDPEAQFLFSISNDDTIEIKDGDRHKIVRIKKSAENKQVFYVPVNDAHTDTDQMKLAIVKSKTPSTLKSLDPRKVVIDLLGKVHPAND
jgi:CRISPR-associated endonuclease Csn1